MKAKGMYENYEVEIDGCVLSISMPKFDVHWLNEYPNELMLSASLACTIGYTGAVKLLTEWEVPHNSKLWHLNHSNPWRDQL